MGWSIGYDGNWNRDIGYGVPAYCDHPDCNKEIHRGLSYVCGGEPYGGEYGCGLFFCSNHMSFGYLDPYDELTEDFDKTESCVNLCERCVEGADPFPPGPDHPEWMRWKLTDESWQQWRDEYPLEVSDLKIKLIGVELLENSKTIAE